MAFLLISGSLYAWRWWYWMRMRRRMKEREDKTMDDKEPLEDRSAYDEWEMKVSRLEHRESKGKTHVSTDTEEEKAFKQNKDLPQVPPIIRGADIVASTTLEVTPGTPLSFYWKEHGMRIHIPAGALKPNTPPQTMSIQASLSGHFKLPDDMELVSAVYWVAFPKRFSCPVMVEVQHCASLEHSDELSSLSFITAKCTQEMLPYNFVPLSGGIFSTDSSYGTIELNHFSGVAVGAKKGKSTYSLHTYYIPRGPVTWLTHFAIVKNLESCLKKVKDFYDIKAADEGPNVIVTLAGDEVAVDIGNQVVSLPSGWCIVPLANPKLPRAIVESYKKGKTIPSIQLELYWSREEQQPQKLLYKINFIGFTAETFIWLSLPGKGSDRNGGTRKEFNQKNVINSLHEVGFADADWEKLGLQLGLAGQVKNIRANHQEVQSCLQELISQWMKIDTNASWEVLAAALGNIPSYRHATANKLQQAVGLPAAKK